MSEQFRARLASVRTTPSRSEDAQTVTRITFEAHDILVDELNAMLDRDVHISVVIAPPPRTPLEDAIDESRNGTAAAVPAAGRRRRGTRAEP